MESSHAVKRVELQSWSVQEIIIVKPEDWGKLYIFLEPLIISSQTSFYREGKRVLPAESLFLVLRCQKMGMTEISV